MLISLWWMAIVPNGLPDDDKKRKLGDAQFEWLVNGLKNSKASSKSSLPVVASPQQGC